MPLQPPLFGIQQQPLPIGDAGQMPFGYEGPGARFVVGAQTAENQGVQGFGQTPQEMLATHRRALASSFGMDPEGAENMQDSAIVGLGEQAARGREQERLRAQGVAGQIAEFRVRQAQQAQQQAAQTTQRRAYLDQEDPGGQNMTPVQKDSIASDPQLWSAHVQEGKQGKELASIAAQKALEKAAAEKQAKQVGESVVQEFPNRPDLADAIKAMAEQGAQPAFIRASMRQRVAGEAAAARESRAAQDRQDREDQARAQQAANSDYAFRQESFKTRLQTTDEMLKFREHELARARAAHGKLIEDTVKARDKGILPPEESDAWSKMGAMAKQDLVEQSLKGREPSTEEYDKAMQEWQDARDAKNIPRRASPVSGASTALHDTMSQLNPEWRSTLARRLQGVRPEHREAELQRFRSEMGIGQ